MALDPVIKWAGGKRWLVPALVEVIRRDEPSVVIEPFAGGAAVSLGAYVERAWLNDINWPLINLYRQIAEGHFRQLLADSLDRRDYYVRRDRFNELLETEAHTLECAQLFYYLNKCGFNGLFRLNRKGKFNVPVGRGGQPSCPSMGPYHWRMKTWSFTSMPFETVLDRVFNQDAFVFADPPYWGTFSSYWKDGFTWPDQCALAERLKRLPCRVVTTNSMDPRIVDLYRALGFRLYMAPGRRSIRPGDSWEAELIATNFPVAWGRGHAIMDVAP